MAGRLGDGDDAAMLDQPRGGDLHDGLGVGIADAREQVLAGDTSRGRRTVVNHRDVVPDSVFPEVGLVRQRV